MRINRKAKPLRGLRRDCDEKTCFLLQESQRLTPQRSHSLRKTAVVFLSPLMHAPWCAHASMGQSISISGRKETACGTFSRLICTHCTGPKSDESDSNGARLGGLTQFRAVA